MQLDSFRVEALEFASNGGLINLKGPANQGAASAAFSGESAEYDVFIVYHDENDGVARIDVLIGNVTLDRWSLDTRIPGGEQARPENLFKRQLAEDFAIEHGTQIQILASQGNWDNANVDYIEFVFRRNTAPVRVEAETMHLETYRVETQDFASGGELINLKGPGVAGSATANFAGSDATYDIYVVYHDENDGQAMLSLSVGGATLDSWPLNEKFMGGAQAREFNRLARQVASAYSVSANAEIRLTGLQGNWDHASVDYIEFVPSSATSTREPELLRVLDDPEPDFGFGAEIAAIGDVDGDGVGDLAASAPFKTANGNDGQGQVAVFSGASGALLYVANHSPPQRNASFGESIAGLGDINGDGSPEFVVGASGSGLGGRVFVHAGVSGALLFSTSSPSASSSSEFGSATVALGDINGDGTIDFAVGDPVDQDVFLPPDQPQGKVFVLSGLNGELIRTIRNPFRDPDVAQLFGSELASVGDIDGDRVPDLVVGAWQQVDRGLASGRAFAFSGRDGTLLHSFDQPDRQRSSEFGRTIAAVGDLNGDNIVDVVIAAPGLELSGVEVQGKAYAYSGVDGTLLYEIDHPIPGTPARLGGRLGAIGDLDGDGVPDYALSATLQNDSRGEVYVISGRTGELVSIIREPTLRSRALFGAMSQVPVGDLDQDGRPDIAVGAPYQSTGSSQNPGRVFIYRFAN